MKTKANRLARHVAGLRIVFGLMWAVDAGFKWQPAFRSGFVDTVTAAAQDQPAWLHWWFNFWTHLLGANPQLFAVLTASLESLIAVALLLGLARRTTYLGATIFSLLIWGVAEGFGGPYTSGSTDIGSAVVYAVVFLALYGLDRLATPPRWSVDNYLGARWHWWRYLANP